MLENNSDRSMYMVGAIVVGAVVVIFAQPLFEKLVKSVGDKLEAWIKGTPDDINKGKTGTIISDSVMTVLPQVATVAAQSAQTVIGL